MRVIGTAGHIDHGKSTLVERLTGIDPDRLAEEKRRGMTIELGFAWLTLPSGQEASIVDVPGHERFIRNMLAGAGGVDVVLLAVAADEGIMPQTREHLAILDLLGVKTGVVALTKADLVDEEWIELVRDEVETALAGTGLAGSPVIPVSAATGRGIDDLLGELDRALAVAPEPNRGYAPYVPIDRVFTVAGFGTVVTGTLHEGELAAGQEIVLVPSGRRGRIRAMQTHRHDVDTAGPGQRVALNISPFTRDEVARGDVLTLPDSLSPTRRFDARLSVLPDAPVPITHGLQVAVHIGAAERPATIAVLGAPEIRPGEEGWVQVRTDLPVAAVARQRFIVRLPSPVGTVAGGQILDLFPRHRRSDPAARVRLEGLRAPDRADTITSLLSDGRPRSAGNVARDLWLPAAVAREGLSLLVAGGTVVKRGDAYLGGDAWLALESRIADALAAFHDREPMRWGMPREELRRRAGVAVADWPATLRLLAGAGLVREQGPLVAAPGREGGVGGRRAEADRLLARLRTDPFAPPSGGDLIAEAGDRGLLDAMAEAGEVVRVADGLYFAADAFAEMRRKVVAAIGAEGPMTVAGARDLLGTSRKYALALLEHLDAERVTRRQGDVRVLGNRRPACA